MKLGNLRQNKRTIRFFIVFLAVFAISAYVLPGAGFHVFALDSEAVGSAQQRVEDSDQTEEPPASPVEIEENEVPLSAVAQPIIPGPNYNFMAWALLNLILVIVSGLIMLGVLLHCIRRLKGVDRNESGYRAKRNRSLGLGILAVGATIASVVLFVNTQDFSLPMIVIDELTVLHAIIAVAVVLVVEFERDKSEAEKGEKVL